MNYFYSLPLILTLLVGCANMDTVRNEDVQDDTTRVFDAAYTPTKKAAMTSLQQLDLHIEETVAVEGGEHIMFSKPISAFSWGEVGRVRVTKKTAARTEVGIRSHKRSRVQITGTSQREFADRIFTRMESLLAK